MNRQQLKEAIDNNCLYDFIANNYNMMTREELKEVLLAVLGICYDRCFGKNAEKMLMLDIEKELCNREFFEDD